MPDGAAMVTFAPVRSSWPGRTAAPAVAVMTCPCPLRMTLPVARVAVPPETARVTRAWTVPPAARTVRSTVPVSETGDSLEANEMRPARPGNQSDPALATAVTM